MAPELPHGPRKGPRERKTVRLDGMKLRRLREAKSKNQQEMAESLDLGVSVYRRLEASEPVDFATAQKLLRGLGLDEADLAVTPGSPQPRDTRTYLAAVHDRNSKIRIERLIMPGTNAIHLHIADMYIPLRVQGASPSDREHGKPDGAEADKPLLLDLLDEPGKKLVIVGHPGSGKTTCLRRLAYEHSGPAARFFPALIRIPELDIFIRERRRKLAESLEPVPEYVSADWVARYLEHAGTVADPAWELDAAFFRGQFSQPGSILLFDGLDELPEASRKDAADLFGRICRAFSDARIAVTTRPATYAGTAVLEGFERVSIGPLDDDAMMAFLERFFDVVEARDREKARQSLGRLGEKFRSRPEVQDLARNPLMLTALACMEANGVTIPDGRAELYRSIISWLCTSRPWESEGNRMSRLCKLALRMQNRTGGRVAEIGLQQAAALIADEFGESTEQAKIYLEQELQDGGILVERGANSIGFFHLTFQEYLAAVKCREDQETHLFAGGRWSTPEWRETLLLVPGGLSVDQRHRFFRLLLDRALEAGPSMAGLGLRASAAGLLMHALDDVHAVSPEYRLPPESRERFRELVPEVLGIFDARRAAGIPLTVRLEAAEALGQSRELGLDGDPRLVAPSEPAYWVGIPAGTFLMGAQKTRQNRPGYDEDAYDDEKPVRPVPFDKPFEIGRYPVTVQEFETYLQDGGTEGDDLPYGWQEQTRHPNRPVTGVSWYGASAYCVWASEKYGGRISLPTEEQWEYAARGPESRKYPWGSQTPDETRANYAATGIYQPSPVGLFPAGNTPEGVADMAGNVWEWTSSDYDRTRKVVRGGCYLSDVRQLRAADRDGVEPGGRVDIIGFRIVREVFP